MSNKTKTLNLAAAFILLTGLLFQSCSLLASANESDGSPSVASVSFDRNNLNMSVGEMEIIQLTIKGSRSQQDQNVTWEYDTGKASLKADNFGAVITVLEQGTITIRAKCSDKSATCVINASDNGPRYVIENPYIYVDQDVVEIEPGETKRVSASLYGGTNNDINGFTFSIDQPAVAAITTEGNYCWLTGKTEGLAKVTVTHSKSRFSYSFLVNSSPSKLSVPYLTTTSNIITLNLTENEKRTVTVQMRNPKSPNYDGDFTITTRTESGEIESDPCVTTARLGTQIEITPIKAGNCCLRVEHPDAVYALDILIRVTEQIESAYIEPSSKTVIVSSEQPQTVEMRMLKDGKEISIDRSEYEWKFSDGAGNFLSWRIYGSEESGKGNSLWLEATETGQAKVTVSHPASQTETSFIVIARNAGGNPKSGKIYITTNFNYLEMKEGSSPAEISIQIANLEDAGSELEWTVGSEAKDGSRENVVLLENAPGKTEYKEISELSLSRSALSSFSKTTPVSLRITPLKAGTAEIIISHPKAANKTKILANILPADSSKTKTVGLTTNNPFVILKKGESAEVRAMSENEEETRKITWSCSSADFGIEGTGGTATVTALGNGAKEAVITVSHPDAARPLTIKAASYESEEDLENLKMIAVTPETITMFTGERQTFSIATLGLTETDTIEISAESGLNETISMECEKQSFTAEALKAGTAEIKATLSPSGKTASAYIEIKEAGKYSEDAPAYLTTCQNSVVVPEGEQTEIEIQPVNILKESWKNISWNNLSPELFDLDVNENKATITARKEGTGKIRVSHPVSKNTLEINVRTGSELIYENKDQTYISTDKSFIEMETGEERIFQAVVAHTATPEITETGLSYTSSDESVFHADYSSNSKYATLRAGKSGQAVLRIAHPDAPNTCEVVVIVKDKGSTAGQSPYITTAQNVVTVCEGDYTSISATLENGDPSSPADWTWTTSDSMTADIVAYSGPTAMISGISPGTVKIRVTNKNTPVPLEIIAICVDSKQVSQKPFIQTSTNMSTLEVGSNKTLTATILGVSQSERNNLSWTIADPTVALIDTAGETCSVKALKEGQTYITVKSLSNSSIYSKTIFLRVEPKTSRDCWIKVSADVITLNPESREGKTIQAALVNGEILDAQNFAWWVDDESLVRISSAADTASIIPTGTSGVTHLHVKHPKVLEQQDILIMVTKVTEFAFYYENATISEKQIHYIPMKVPTSMGATQITYESSNPNVCAATGTKAVCMLAGIKKGSAKITAIIKNETGEIARAELAVIVTPRTEIINEINVGTTIINMTKGENLKILSTLSGQEIASGDENATEWTTSDPSVISLLATETSVTRGREAYVTARSAGSAVITVTHPKCKYPQTIWVISSEQKEPVLRLDQTYVELYIGDGTKRVTAEVINGSKTDPQSIMWTCPKVNNTRVASATATAGDICTLAGMNAGTTVLRAQLPNGNYADCIVTVYTTAEVKFTTKTIHVVPGYDEVVKYEITPENATLMWVSQINGLGSLGAGQKDPFTFQVNESTHEIAIHGIDVGSGNIIGMMNGNYGTAKAQLTVVTEYMYDVEFDAGGVVKTTPRPGTEERIDFHVWPYTLEVECSSENPDTVEIKDWSINRETGKGHVTIVPKKECENARITLRATNPGDPANTPIVRTQLINTQYDQIHITPVFNYKTGQFSKVNRENGSTRLVLGDGEAISFYLKVEEPNADVSDVSVYWHDGPDEDTRADDPSTQKQEGLLEIKARKTNGAWLMEPDGITENGAALYKLAHAKDTTTQALLFDSVWEPVTVTPERWKIFGEDEYYKSLCSRVNYSLLASVNGKPGCRIFDYETFNTEDLGLSEITYRNQLNMSKENKYGLESDKANYDSDRKIYVMGISSVRDIYNSVDEPYAQLEKAVKKLSARKKNRVIVRELRDIRNGGNWLTYENHRFDFFPTQFEYLTYIADIPTIPGYISNITSKDFGIKKESSSYLTIVYKRNGKSENTEKIDVKVETRNCSLMDNPDDWEDYEAYRDRGKILKDSSPIRLMLNGEDCEGMDLRRSTEYTLSISIPDIISYSEIIIDNKRNCEATVSGKTIKLTPLKRGDVSFDIVLRKDGNRISIKNYYLTADKFQDFYYKLGTYDASAGRIAVDTNFYRDYDGNLAFGGEAKYKYNECYTSSYPYYSYSTKSVPLVIKRVADDFIEIEPPPESISWDEGPDGHQYKLTSKGFLGFEIKVRKDMNGPVCAEKEF